MNARIYDRPDLDQNRGRLALYVLGTLPNAVPFLAYEGRLQIYNGVGDCFVRQVDGATLPEGHRLYVDQATKEVVLAWPAYIPGSAPIENPGFEAGQQGWDCGSGWVIGTENPPTGSWAAGYNNQAGESIISSQARYTVHEGQVTQAKCKVRQGASSEGNAGASVVLQYRNAAGDVVRSVEGNRVMSASKNRVYDSNVVGTAQAGEASINIAGNGIRYRENKILFVDDFEWDHTVAAAGINYETMLCITLIISDSAGRSVRWSGCIQVGYPGSGIAAAVRHWWNMDETSSAFSLVDQTGSAPLALVNKAGVTFRGSSIRSGGSAAMHFSGDSAATSSNFPSWIPLTDDYAVAAWVRMDAPTSAERRTVVGDAPAVDDSESMPLNFRINVNVTPAGQAEAFWEHGVGIDDNVVCSDPLVPGENVLMIVSRDGASKEIVCHVNGVRVADLSYVHNPEGGGDPSKRLTVGNVQSLDQPFLGYLQDVAIFDRPLTDAEAEWLYNGGAGRSYAEVTSGGEPSGALKIGVTVAAQSESMLGFPIYIDLAGFPSEFWEGLIYGDGRDIRVKDGTGSDVTFDLVHCSRTAMRGELFVRVDLSASEETAFFIHFGDPAVDEYVDPLAPNGRNATWSGYSRVYAPGFSMEDRTGAAAEAALPEQFPALAFSTVSPVLSAHQGVCWDGSHYYAVDTNAIRKYDAAWNLVGENLNPVGDVGAGTNHCGDPEVVGGVLYIPVESYTSETVYSAMHMARFSASDLSYISSTDISAQAHEASSFGYNPADGYLYCASYNHSNTIWRYALDGTFVSTLTIATPLPRLQGITFWRGYMWLSSNSGSGTTKGVWRSTPSGTGMVQVVVGAAGLPGSIMEGLSSKDNEGLLLLTDNIVPNANLTLLQHRGVLKGYDARALGARPAAVGVPVLSQWTMATVCMPSSIDSNSRAVLSYCDATSTDGSTRATLAKRSTGYYGLWNSSDSWISDSTAPAAANVSALLHATQNGTAGRGLYLNGAVAASAGSSAQRPVGSNVSLFFGIRDVGQGEGWIGDIGFTYLRSGVLSSQRAAAESANLRSPGTFYSVGAVVPG
ncbi:MAG TPA: hypothetical protein DCP40_14875 [Stenotrophomonas sp.]|nr:hypothetical protein [Stenotrophomonas sp.]